MQKNSDTSIKVVCRLRPINQLEMNEGGQCCVDFDETNISVQYGNPEKANFAFDRIFGPDSEQHDIYEFVAQPILDSVMNGYNGTIFAYGQTSSGKTFTMEGPNNYNGQTKGLIPRVFHGIFDYVQNASDECLYVIKASFVEIYNEKVNDLLDPSRHNLQVKEDKLRGVYIAGLTEIFVNNPQEMQEVMNTGAQNRTIASTRMNERSSRSHSLFIIQVMVKNLKVDSTQYSKLYFVDLAGSEKVAKTQVSGQQLEEAKNINKSLTTLGMVINALTSDKKEHVPYRDSKLTRVLSESLGGNSKTTLIVACSMCSYNDKETISTLRFGARAKAIKNKPKVNQQKNAKELQILLDIAEKKLKDQEDMINALTLQLQQGGSEVKSCKQFDSPLTKAAENQTQQQLKLLQQHMQIVNLTEENDKLTTELASKEIQLQNRIEEMNEKMVKLKHQDEQLKEQYHDLFKRNQKSTLENEHLKQTLQESESRISEFKRIIESTKIDVKYLVTSLSLKQYGNNQYISDTESTRSVFAQDQIDMEQQEKTIQGLVRFSDTINQLENMILKNEPYSSQEISLDKNENKQQEKRLLDLDVPDLKDLSYIQSKQDDHRLLNFLESHNTSVDQLDDDIKMVSSDFESINNKSLQIFEEDQKEDTDLQKIIQLLSDKIDTIDNLYPIQDLFHKQRKHIYELQEKCRDIYSSYKHLEEKQAQIIANHQYKIHKFRQIYQKKKHELSVQNHDLQKQLEDLTCEFASFRQKRDSSLNILQNQNQKLQQSLETQQKFMSTQEYFDKNPLSREYQLECTIKQMMHERQEMFHSLQQYRTDNEKLREQNKSLQQQFEQENKLKLQDQAYQGLIFRRGPLGGQQKIRSVITKGNNQVKEWYINSTLENDDGQPKLINELRRVNILNSKNVGAKVDSGHRGQLVIGLGSTYNELQKAFSIDQKSVGDDEYARNLSPIIGSRSIVQREIIRSSKKDNEVLQEAGINTIIEQLDNAIESPQPAERKPKVSFFSKLFG